MELNNLSVQSERVHTHDKTIHRKTSTANRNLLQYVCHQLKSFFVAIAIMSTNRIHQLIDFLARLDPKGQAQDSELVSEQEPSQANLENSDNERPQNTQVSEHSETTPQDETSSSDMDNISINLKPDNRSSSPVESPNLTENIVESIIQDIITDVVEDDNMKLEKLRAQFTKPIWNTRDAWMQEFLANRTSTFSTLPDISKLAMGFIPLIQAHTNHVRAVLNTLKHNTTQTELFQKSIEKFQQSTSALKEDELDLTVMCETAEKCAVEARDVLDEIREASTIISDLFSTSVWLSNIASIFGKFFVSRKMLIKKQATIKELPPVDIKLDNLHTFKTQTFIPMLHRMIISLRNQEIERDIQAGCINLESLISNLCAMPLSPGSTVTNQEVVAKLRGELNKTTHSIQETTKSPTILMHDLLDLESLFGVQNSATINILRLQIKRHTQGLTNQDIDTRVLEHISDTVSKVCASIIEQASDSTDKIQSLQQQLLQNAAEILKATQ